MWAFLIQAAGESSPPLLSLGVGGAIALGVIGMWRVDRKESQDRYERLAGDFRTIVQDNTKALTALGEKMGTLAERLGGSDALTVRMLVNAIRKGEKINIEPLESRTGGAD